MVEVAEPRSTACLPWLNNGRIALVWIKRVEIENVRSIEKIEWEIGHKASAGAGWHVVLGDNGSGKSSFLRSIALVLIGPENAAAAGQDWRTWVRLGENRARISLTLSPDPSFDKFAMKGKTNKQTPLRAGVEIERDGPATAPRPLDTSPIMKPDRHIWGKGLGWFSASYGPFRRFTGGDRDAERGFLTNPRVGAHLSVFGEKVSLVESLYWLQSLHHKALERKPEGALLGSIKNFVNQDDFLPHGVKLVSISSSGVAFEDSAGLEVEVEELGDGFRSMLSMTFELIRQLSAKFEPSEIFTGGGRTIGIPGVVLIDEVDAHLHPSWQKRIGFWLTEHFPRMQFIVTTHSPLICHAAEKGSIFALPVPGAGGSGRILQGAERDRLVYGDVSDAYATEAFGVDDTGSPESHRMRERLAVLNTKEIREGLSRTELREQERLRATFPAGVRMAQR